MLDPYDEQVIQECKEGGATLVTWDRVLRVEAGGLTPYQALEHALEKGEAIQETIAEVSRLRQLTPAQLTVMADGADKTWAAYHEFIPVTRVVATRVRQLRVEQDYSWRAIARYCSRVWLAPWGADQIAGMVICEKAATLLTEDFLQPPWN